MPVTVLPQGADKIRINPDKLIMVVVPSALSPENKVTLVLEGGVMLKLDQDVYESVASDLAPHLVGVSKPEPFEG